MQNIILKTLIKRKNPAKEPLTIHNKTKQNKIDGASNRVREKESKKRPEQQYCDCVDDCRSVDADKLTRTRP